VNVNGKQQKLLDIIFVTFSNNLKIVTIYASTQVYILHIDRRSANTV